MGQSQREEGHSQGKEEEEEELYRVAVVDRFDDKEEDFEEAQWMTSWLEEKKKKNRSTTGGKGEDATASRRLLLAVAQRTSLTQAALQAADEIAITDFGTAGVAQRAIALGNTFHKTAVLAGLGGLIGTSANRLRIPALGLLGLSVTCALAYDLDWQRDFLCKYQVHKDRSSPPIVCQFLAPGAEATVLVRRDDSARKVLHNTIAFLALAAATFTAHRAGWIRFS
ncbi:hypothetical protein PTSG_01726 [Salpingoeca rosetta]|uniref:Transmembrane protein n=1 Tax=Salpingoeca rosetta (strain ATCC 50818 / BSB-021) TaxID=946362 RepID=F2TYS3_SALR5|nr:uncharacterized protein PTSG_01726 [Salpingoeca rosetta]EGD78747.1 hypothetical protein PTSG_01726 [Salpingoeca rosetta]|eukprot:XP_004997704.1 hypothetical protein PTSG_01726 [Salpingoeca rosetta]